MRIQNGPPRVSVAVGLTPPCAWGLALPDLAQLAVSFFQKLGSSSPHKPLVEEQSRAEKTGSAAFNCTTKERLWAISSWEPYHNGPQVASNL